MYVITRFEDVRRVLRRLHVLVLVVVDVGAEAVVVVDVFWPNDEAVALLLLPLILDREDVSSVNPPIPLLI